MLLTEEKWLCQAQILLPLALAAALPQRSFLPHIYAECQIVLVSARVELISSQWLLESCVLNS